MTLNAKERQQVVLSYNNKKAVYEHCELHGKAQE